MTAQCTNLSDGVKELLAGLILVVIAQVAFIVVAILMYLEAQKYASITLLMGSDSSNADDKSHSKTYNTGTTSDRRESTLKATDFQTVESIHVRDDAATEENSYGGSHLYETIDDSKVAATKFVEPVAHPSPPNVITQPPALHIQPVLHLQPDSELDLVIDLDGIADVSVADRHYDQAKAPPEVAVTGSIVTYGMDNPYDAASLRSNEHAEYPHEQHAHHLILGEVPRIHHQLHVIAVREPAAAAVAPEEEELETDDEHPASLPRDSETSEESERAAIRRRLNQHFQFNFILTKYFLSGESVA